MIGSAVLLASLLAAGDNSAKTNAAVEARWRREYPRAAEELEAMNRDFLAKGSYFFHFFSGDTITTKELTVASSGDKRLIVRDRQSSESPKSPNRSEPEDTTVRCETADYAFLLSRRPTSSNFIVETYGTYKEDDRSHFQYLFKNFARNSTVYFGPSLLQRMQHPSFALKSIEALERDGGEIVRIGYDYEGEDFGESGTVDLDPGKNWAIRNVDVTCRLKDGNLHELKVEVEYQKVDDTRFFPRRMESIGRNPRTGLYQHMLVEYREIKLGGVPDEIFRLSAYGLPDIPLRPAPRPSVFTFRNPFFWLSLAAAVTSFAILWVMRARRAREA